MAARAGPSNGQTGHQPRTPAAKPQRSASSGRGNEPQQGALGAALAEALKRR